MKGKSAYEFLTWPEPPTARPYIVMNMISTIDGKITTGGRDEPVKDLGSENDYATMRFIEKNVDAVMIGAGSLRATPKIWYRSGLLKYVVSASGNVPTDNRFFTDEPNLSWVVLPSSSAISDSKVQCLVSPGNELDWHSVLSQIRTTHGVKTLLLEGGSILNSALFHAGVVDEIFLTIAPKIRLGESTPTIADGVPFNKDQIQNYSILSHNLIENELFLRYKRLGA